MKQNLPIIYFLFFFFGFQTVNAQAPDSTLLIKGEADTLLDYVSWPNKGHIGLIPVQMQPWLNNNQFLNYGIGLEAEFILPVWVTIRAKASVNLYEGEKSVWKEKLYDGVDDISNGYWVEGGIDLNFSDIKGNSIYTITDSTGKSISVEGTRREYRKGKYEDRTINYSQQIFGNYYTFESYLYRPALRMGFVQYKNTYLDKNAVIPLVTNLNVNMAYGGFSFSKIGLGRAHYIMGYFDLLYKISLKAPDYAAYEDVSKSGLIGYRGGLKASSDWLGCLLEVGMAPGLKTLDTYFKLGLVINYHLMPPRKNKYKKIIEIEDSEEK
jgi:hypothetical protein